MNVGLTLKVHHALAAEQGIGNAVLSQRITCVSLLMPNDCTPSSKTLISGRSRAIQRECLTHLSMERNPAPGMWPLHYQWQNIHFSIYFSIMIILKHKLFISVSEDLKTSLHPYFLINIAISHTIAVVFAFNQSCIAQVTSASSVKINLGFHWNTMEKQ